ncbi:unnamed protein product [Caenorhabditis brenneri]
MVHFSSFILPIFLLISIQIAEIQSDSVPEITVSAKVGETLELPIENATKITRYVYNAKNVQIEQVFRVCNGKNKKTCGYWENTKNKKKVTRVTNYNKKKGIMTIPKAKKADAGVYRGPNYLNVYVYVF